MTQILIPLAGLLAGGGVYLALSQRPWPRLVGIALAGQALPLLLLAAGGLAPQATAGGLVLALIAFGWFLAEANKLSARQGEDPPRPEEET